MRTGKDLQLAIDEAWENKMYYVSTPPGIHVKIYDPVVNPGVSVVGLCRANPTRLTWRGKGDGPMMKLNTKSPLNLFLGIQNLLFVGGRALESDYGFTRGCFLERLFFWRCPGPVVRLENCSQAVIRNLVFHTTTGEALVVTGHNAGVLVDNVRLGGSMGDKADRAAFVFQGSGGDLRLINVDASAKWPGKPIIQIQDSHAMSLRNVRGEGGDSGVVAETMVRLLNCHGCLVETVLGSFQYGTDALSVVDVVGGYDNHVTDITGGGWRTLRPEGAIVTYRHPDEVEVGHICNVSRQHPDLPDLFRWDKRGVAESAASGVGA